MNEFKLARLTPLLLTLLLQPLITNASGGGAIEFDWQAEWGTIHMNSFADGFLDPGARSSTTGYVPCNRGGDPAHSLCSSDFLYGPQPNPRTPETVVDIDNGIKYDLKNSILNCMAVQTPSSPVLNGGWPSSYPVDTCNLAVPVAHKPLYLDFLASGLTYVPTLVYSPIWDARTQDTRDRNPSGCVQQIANNCSTDIHECSSKYIAGPKLGMSTNDGPGYKHPVTHVFNPEEIMDLMGPSGSKDKPMPMSFYTYDKITELDTPVTNSLTPAPAGDYVDLGPGIPIPATATSSAQPTYNYAKILKHRPGLSLTNPEGTSSIFPGTNSTLINNNVTDPNLARIKSYKIKFDDLETGTDNFIIVDPSDFFDMSLYIAGGKYDSGYNSFKNGLPETPASCPILAVGAYDGICDPTGKAGCNLPIYKVGPVTTMKDYKDNTFSTTSYPIAWSGYVKKWEFITPAQYLSETANRKSVFNAQLYAQADEINSNKILKIERANDYCLDIERYSGKVIETIPPTPPDMPCVQYLQYQDRLGDILIPDPTVSSELFFDLFQPGDSALVPTEATMQSLQLFDVDEQSKHIVTAPITGGSGTDRYIKPDKVGRGSGYATFLDTEITYTDRSKGGIAVKALKKANYKGTVQKVDNKTVSGPIFSSKDIDPNTNALRQTVGEESGDGTSIRLEPGKSVIAQFPGLFYSPSAPISPYCAVFTIAPDKTENFFIPTNSYAEFQNFLTAASKNPVSGISARACVGSYKTYNQAKGLPIGTANANPNGSKTFIGLLTCDQLTDKPACNQTKRITAVRSCLLENGTNGSCEECASATDPDAALIAGRTALSVGGMLVPTSDKCFVSAICTAKSAAVGCSSPSGSGGHIFCLAPDTKISMADGTKKAIIDIKAGEEVMAFDAKHSKRVSLMKVMVKATAITEDQEVMKIDDTIITPDHKVILASGRAIAASSIRPGDKILKGDGKVAIVKKIEKGLPKIKVYNLVLDKESDGYIANGLRVLSYPKLKGM